jgi:hypothetical protein
MDSKRVKGVELARLLQGEYQALSDMLDGRARLT